MCAYTSGDRPRGHGTLTGSPGICHKTFISSKGEMVTSSGKPGGHSLSQMMKRVIHSSNGPDPRPDTLRT